MLKNVKTLAMLHLALGKLKATTSSKATWVRFLMVPKKIWPLQYCMICHHFSESLSYFHLMTLPYREFAAVWMTFMDDWFKLFLHIVHWQTDWHWYLLSCYCDLKHILPRFLSFWFQEDVDFISNDKIKWEPPPTIDTIQTHKNGPNHESKVLDSRIWTLVNSKIEWMFWILESPLALLYIDINKC